MKHSCRAANLRAILDDPEIRPHVTELVEAYTHLQSEDRRGTRLRESVSLGTPSSASGEGATKSMTLEDAWFKALLEFMNLEAGGERFVDIRERRRIPGTRQLLNRGVHVPSVHEHGVSYRAEANSSKDSNIMFWTDQSHSSFSAGRILKIFSYSYREVDGQIIDGTYLFVHPYAELSEADTAHDYYRKYPFVGGQLYYERRMPGIVITPGRIISHVARTPIVMPGIADPCVHILPLDKVFPSTLIILKTY